MEINDRPRVNPVAVLREEFDDWAVLFNPDTAEAVGTNPVGVFVWKKMNGGNTLERIVGMVRESFEGVPEEAAEEVLRFVKELAEKGFLLTTGELHGSR
jgi:SynChlorMet cassette protein ScmD